MAPSKLWSVGAKVAAIVPVAALAAYVLGGLPRIWDDVRAAEGPLGTALAATGGVVEILFAAAILLLAWRMWARWNATTVRIVVGAAVGLGTLVVAVRVEPFLTPYIGRKPAEAVSAVASVFLLAAGAFAYRKLSGQVIRRSGLPDPVDEYDRPLGRTARQRWFAKVLGLCVFSAAIQLERLKGHTPSWLVLIPPIAGWAAYRLFIWWTTPVTRPVEPLGGFEVIVAPPGE